MKVDKFIADLEDFMKTKPCSCALTEWLDTYSVSKADLVMVIQDLIELEKRNQTVSNQILIDIKKLNQTILNRMQKKP